MRILAIRGENLASLGEAFAIEFEREPLRSAGLFAITGETGAGKSTILDALCLALYDKFPRVVAPGGGEGSPDPSGETLAAGDPRAILRRGAGRGYAEADFIARDGERYRARCDLARARGKFAGKLQNRGRSLWRLDESGAVVAAIESGVEPVNRRIVELTDLTFDQFRRTVLLAQGDFDAFLRADARERAELLEKITGAEIYGRLSKRAFDFAREAQQKVATLEQRRADVGALPEEERVAALEERARIADQRVALAAERESILVALRRHEALAQAQAKLAQAEADRAAAAAALEALGAQCATLADLARAEPLRGPRADARRAENALAEKREDLARALAQAQEAREALEAAQAREGEASAALAAINDQIERLKPIWALASERDSRIAALKQEETQARLLAEEASRSAVLKREERAAILAQQAEAERARESARGEFERLIAARPLSERWNEIDEWLAKRVELLEAEREAGEGLRAALAELKRGGVLRAAFDEADKADREARDAILAQLDERGAALAALDEPGAQRRAEEIAREHDLLQALIRFARENDDAQTKAARADAETAGLAQDTRALAQELEKLRILRNERAAQREEAERLGDLADAAADRHALRLRASLEDDAPCPVCGGREHPFAHSRDAAQQLVAEMRAKREEARRALAQTDAEIIDVSAREAKARALHDDATRRRCEAEAAVACAAQEYEALLIRRPHAPKAIGGAAPQLEAMAARVAAERDELGERLAAARRLREELERLREQGDEKRNALEERRAERDALMLAAQRAAEERARFEARLASNRERIDSLDRSLAPFLILCDLVSADLDRDAPGAGARLEQAGKRFQAAKLNLDALERECAALELRAAKSEAEADGATRGEADAKAAHEARRRALGTLRAERAELLGGEATASHRARHEEESRLALTRRDQMREALAEAGKAKAACDARSARSATDVENAERALATAREVFTRALEASGFDEATAAPLLALAPEDVAAMRRLTDAAQAALAAAKTAVAARRVDLEDATAAGAVDESRETLVARDAELTQQLDALAARLGALQEVIAQDDAARARVEALSRDIDEARASRRLWDEINEAIGSANGDKFRRFAQSVTLEQLVALANRRLALLAPRYALERSGEIGSLGLQIVDRDLGEERRSTRSLSGGERFLASLALALALAGLEGRDSFVDTLFIDEGFGALDSATLDVAIDALENLQGQGRKVGVISHVESLHQRIATKICVERRGGGLSVVRLRAAGGFSGLAHVDTA